MFLLQKRLFLTLSPALSPYFNITQQRLVHSINGIIFVNSICYVPVGVRAHTEVAFPPFTAGKHGTECLTRLAQIGGCYHWHLGAGVCGLNSCSIYIEWC